MKYRKKRKLYKYELVEPECVITLIVGDEIETPYIQLLDDGLLKVKAKYAWDGASGPTIDSKSSMRGSLFHDALYQLLRMGAVDLVWRNAADILFHEVCLADGMWKFRADYYFCSYVFCPFI